jgi:rare lipoprotein A
MHKMTAAHRELPFGTRVKVTNLSNQKSVTLRINDRGPFVKGRIIDVSYEAAKRLDFVEKGVTRVRVQVVK